MNSFLWFGLGVGSGIMFLKLVDSGKLRSPVRGLAGSGSCYWAIHDKGGPTGNDYYGGKTKAEAQKRKKKLVREGRAGSGARVYKSC